MKARKIIAALLRGGLCAVALAALTPATARAVGGVCNGFITFDYPEFSPGVPQFIVPPPQEFDVAVNFGTGIITGGPRNVLVVEQFKVNMACNADFPLFGMMGNCIPDVGKVEYVGIAQDTCKIDADVHKITCSVGPPDGNVVTCTFDSPVDIPAGRPPVPGACEQPLKLRLRVLGESTNDVTPGEIEETAAYVLAKCDNDRLASTEGQSGAIEVRSSLPDFQCREIPRRGPAPKPDERVTVVDPLFTDTVTVRRYLDLCAPVDKNGENPGAPFDPTHLVHVKIEEVDWPGKVPGVTVLNQMGTFVVDVGVPESMLVPALKTLVPDPPPVPPAPTDINHYVCHKVPDKKVVYEASLIDQFTAPNPYRMATESQKLLCLAASKNGELIPYPDAHLFCLRTKNLGNPLGLVANIVTQFFGGEPRQAELTQATEFCVQSTIILP